MAYCGRERRKFERYDMEMKVHFYVHYDMETKVKFEVIEEEKSGSKAKKYSGLSKDFSIEGMRFSSDRKIKKGENLRIEVYLPQKKSSIPMMGQVRWSAQVAAGIHREI